MPDRRVAEPTSSVSTRVLLGIATVGLALAALGFWITDNSAGAGVLARSAAVLGATWVAFPAFGELRWQSVLIGLGALAAIVSRPRSGWVVALAAGVALSMARRRGGRR